MPLFHLPSIYSLSNSSYVYAYIYVYVWFIIVYVCVAGSMRVRYCLCMHACVACSMRFVCVCTHVVTLCVSHVLHSCMFWHYACALTICSAGSMRIIRACVNAWWYAYVIRTIMLYACRMCAWKCTHCFICMIVTCLCGSVYTIVHILVLCLCGSVRTSVYTCLILASVVVHALLYMLIHIYYMIVCFSPCMLEKRNLEIFLSYAFWCKPIIKILC